MIDPENVRQELLSLWPQLTRVYGLKPWEADLLTFEEWKMYLDDFRRLQRAAEKERGEIDQQLAKVSR